MLYLKVKENMKNVTKNLESPILKNNHVTFMYSGHMRQERMIVNENKNRLITTVEMNLKSNTINNFLLNTFKYNLCSITSHDSF